MRYSLAPYLLAAASLLGLAPAHAQTKGDVNAQRTTERVVPRDPTLPAHDFFGRVGNSAPGAASPIGFYSKGCLQGAVEVQPDGPQWQVMRPSRNRAWGHPVLVSFLQRMAAKTPSETGWPGLLLGDMSQPRGGPMLTGHASHQIGLDADLWLTPMPERRLSRLEREEMSATNVVREDRLDILPGVWSASHRAFIRMLAREPETERVFVNPAIKKALCRESDRASRDQNWLSKVRPTWGHNYHVHVRLTCPAGATNCASQDKPPQGDGCDASLDWWFTDEALNPKPTPPRPPLRIVDLPSACTDIISR